MSALVYTPDANLLHGGSLLSFCFPEQKERPMGKRIDITGQKIGRLTVTGPAGYNKHGALEWSCVCECGKAVVVGGQNLRRGLTRSCGCLKIDTVKERVTRHGQSKTALHAIWQSMIGRCHSPTNRVYALYGGRGIKVCEHWRTFENFLADMGEPAPGMTLDRIDNDGDYCPENVRWRSMKEQSNNRRSNRYIEHDGRRQTLSQWANEAGIPAATLKTRLNAGWSMDRALLKIDGRAARHVKPPA